MKRCKPCGAEFVPQGNRRYCSDGCRKEAHRRRKPPHIRANVFKIYDSAEVAWAAGFLDGEGCFGIRTEKAYFTPTIEAAQVGRRAPLDLLARLFGGNVREVRRSFLSRPLYRWSITGAPRTREAVAVLIPFLVVKQAEAQQVLLASMWTGDPGDQRVNPLAWAFRAEARRHLLELRTTYAE